MATVAAAQHSHLALRALARSGVYGLLASAMRRPTPEFSKRLGKGAFARELEQTLKSLPTGKPLQSQAQQLGLWAKQNPRECSMEGLSHLDTILFEHAQTIPCPPYEAEYGLGHVFIKTQCLADIAGFYRAFGLEESAGVERLDHIAAEMEFMQFVAFKEAYAHHQGEVEGAELCREAQKKFLAEHLGRWVGGFATAAEEAAPGSFYTRMARLAALFIQHEVESFGVKPELVALRPELLTREYDPVLDELSCGGCPVTELPNFGQAR